MADLLPDYPNSETAGRITVRHLLEHTSGLGDIFTEDFFRSSKALYRAPSDFFPLFANEPLEFEPGASERYSNAGYLVLGAIVERLSGMTFDEYVQRQVFDPAEMMRSGMFARDEPEPDVAIGYTRMTPKGPGETLYNNHFRLPIKSSPAGSAYCTAEDLLRFDTALRTYKILPPAYAHWVVGGPEPDRLAAVAHGDRVRLPSAFAGGAPGVSAVLESDGFLTVVLLSNFDQPGVGAVMRSLRPALAAALAENG